jgi:hypothetical protein
MPPRATNLKVGYLAIFYGLDCILVLKVDSIQSRFEQQEADKDLKLGSLLANS